MTYRVPSKEGIEVFNPHITDEGLPITLEAHCRMLKEENIELKQELAIFKEK